MRTFAGIVFALIVIGLAIYEFGFRCVKGPVELSAGSGRILEKAAHTAELESELEQLRRNLSKAQAEILEHGRNAAQLQARIRALEAQAPPPPAAPKCNLKGACQNPTSAFECAANYHKFENPLLNVNYSRDYAQRFSKLPDGYVDFRVPDQLAFWRANLRSFAVEMKARAPYAVNGYITETDAVMIYSMARFLKPKRVIEIGSGFSTKVMLSALAINRQENASAELTCIEPFRAHLLEGLDVKLVKDVLQNVSVDLFRTLEANDILFVDSSHVLAPYGDVILEYIFLMPLLRPGVFVHIHDVFLPYDYYSQWMGDKQQRPYTEQWLLAAMLRGNPEFEIVFSTHYMTRNHSDLFTDASTLNDRDSSFWIKKVA